MSLSKLIVAGSNRFGGSAPLPPLLSVRSGIEPALLPAAVMNSTIIPDQLDMTRICPDPIPKRARDLFADMEALTARFSALAAGIGCLSIIDLARLKPLMDQDEEFRFLVSLLSSDEERRLAGFTYPKRRREWLGGRLAAKRGLSRTQATEPASACWYRDYSLLPDASGRPSLHDYPAQEPIPAVSISHSREYATALVVATGPCGIDIQQKSAQLVTVQERFATEEELVLLDRVDDLRTRLGILWTAKEAVKKCLLADQPTFFGRISLTEVAYQSEGAIWKVGCRVTGRDRCTATVRIAEFDDYLIACTAGEPYA